MNERTCAVADCCRPTKAKGLCDRHYFRFRKHGDPTAVMRRGPKPRTCIVIGCGKPHQAKGLCMAHYQADRRQKRKAAGTRLVATVAE